jgi:hypothetical protein
MDQLIAAFAVDSPRLFASVLAFAAFFLIARVAHARQGVALAFGFTPLLAFFIAQAAAQSAVTPGLL